MDKKSKNESTLTIYAKAVGHTLVYTFLALVLGVPVYIGGGIGYLCNNFGIFKNNEIAFAILVMIIIFFIVAGIVAVKELSSFNLKNEERILAEQERVLAETNQKKEEIAQKEDELKEIINENSQRYPWLAKLVSDRLYERDLKVAYLLDHKSHPAYKAADTVRQIGLEKRELTKLCKEYENQLHFYENLFPWLEDFRELPPKEAYSYVENFDEDDEYERVKEWLSVEEYQKLPSHEKWQKALDRYKNRSNKTNWHIGIEYERYIGYLYENKGYKIQYEGALKGLDDRGRDIIVHKKNEHLVVQCKRWSREKTIHEKHIMQLFGSVMVLNMESEEEYKGVFVTTTSLSDIARYFAEVLGIEVIDNYPYKDYPMIKCNKGQKGEKIYHLPFDQQYDKININKSKNSFYISTVKEAEDMGYRHAYKWKGIFKK